MLHNKPIFTAKFCRQRIVSVREVRECLETAQHIVQIAERIQYCNSVCIDYVHANKYIEIVEHLDNCYTKHLNVSTYPDLADL